MAPHQTGLILPPGVKQAWGRDRFPLPDVLPLPGGTRLKFESWFEMAGYRAQVYVGPRGLQVMVTLDAHGEPFGTLLHASLSLPRGYPDWDLIYTVTRAVFGDQVDAMLPLPREEAFLHGAVEAQRSGKLRQVFHLVEMPQAWPREGAD